MKHSIKYNETKKQKINPVIHSLFDENYPLIEFLYSKDIVDYVFSFIQIYHVILKLVSKSWCVYFKNLRVSYFYTQELVEEMIKSNDLNLLKWLRQDMKGKNEYMNHIFYDYFDICTKAALNGHLDILKWATKNSKFSRNQFTCANAALNGHLDCLKWARENGYPWDKWTCYNAIFNGHLDCLKWARGNGCPWDEDTCCGAALNGHLDCLKWARGNGCPWDEDTCSSAAYNGHLDCLKWARENGCPWNKWTCSSAASNGHLDCLKWARENGCPWDESTITMSFE